MSFLKSFFVAVLFAAVIYYGTIALLIDAPIPAEYWVPEMMTVKKELMKPYAGQKKIVIAGGSSTLFGVSAEAISAQLNRPVFNYGLHAGLRLENILDAVGPQMEAGDILILSLEPFYFDCRAKFDAWHISNIIAWDHEVWKKMQPLEKLEFVTLIPFRDVRKMLVAKYQQKFKPAKVAERLAAQDSALVLSKFHKRTPPTEFKYSAYNLNEHGDMLFTQANKYKGKGFDFSGNSRLCPKTAGLLGRFIAGMEKKGVQVYFSNTPYLATGQDLSTLRLAEAKFLEGFSPLGCFIDKREELIFEPVYFFDSNFHLNAQGRSLRTDSMINAIRNKVLGGTCK